MTPSISDTNSKSQYRNPKQFQISKYQTTSWRLEDSIFDDWSLFVIWCLGFGA
jgi:hypothetical protein